MTTNADQIGEAKLVEMVAAPVTQDRRKLLPKPGKAAIRDIRARGTTPERAAPSPPAQIDADDLADLQEITGNLEAIGRRIGELRDELTRLGEAEAMGRGALLHATRRAGAKYGLDLTRDTIDRATGAIVRGAAGA